MSSYKNKKVMTIGMVSELTGLSERKIRYYEERKLVFPERTIKGTRKYSFADVEKLVEIAERREDGVQTHEIKQEFRRKEKNTGQLRKNMLRGQLNAYFNKRD